MSAALTVVDKEELREIIAGVLDLDVEDVTDDALFVDDLEVDSLPALEVVVVLEKRYGLRLLESELSVITSLAGAHTLLQARLAP